MEATLKNEPIHGTGMAEDVFQALDRGMDDMENGRELPLEEAFEQIQALRDERRNAGNACAGKLYGKSVTGKASS